MKVFIINGHPAQNSFNSALAEAYAEGARKANAQVEVLHLHKLQFDLNLPTGYSPPTPLEPDLKGALELIHWSDHQVWIHPIWWYSMPALLKGFIDRVFLPGETYRYDLGQTLPEKLLKGKTARIITTADSPYWYYRWVLKRPATQQLKVGTLQFCGIKPVKTTFFGPVRTAKPEKRNQWIATANTLGNKLV